jgi:hypothetical protein
MVTGNRRRDGFLDKPWAVVAVVAGVLFVAACAFLFFTGGSGNATGLSTSVTPPSSGVTAPAAGSYGPSGVLTYRVAPTRSFELTNVVVPAQGVFIKVSYRGEYEGMYSSGNDTEELHNSGERVFALDNPGPAIFAMVKKEDSSAKQPLTVELWKDGTRLASNTTTLPFGEVTVNGNI